MTSVHIIGSGISGLSCAHALQTAGCTVTLTTASDGPDESCCSWWAGGMLAPFCEQESAEPLIGKLGAESMSFWQNLSESSELSYHANGTLVVAPARDQAMLRSFERLTEQSSRVDHQQLITLEPDLNHFNSGLFYKDEAHIEPRLAVQVLWAQLIELGVTINTQQPLADREITQASQEHDWQIDCRGLAASNSLSDLRGVKGEMLHIYSTEVELNRPVRLLHPRYPLYIVPRPNNQFMVGATMIEANNKLKPTVRSVLELLSAAYTVHPAFGEAEIVEIGVDARPAFNDNLPKIRRYGNQIYVNGLYRHGYLGAPALARRVMDLIINGTVCAEVIDANYPEWPTNRNTSNVA